MIMRKLFSLSPAIPRAFPFVLFVILTSTQGSFGPDSAYWIYLLKTLVGIWLIYEMWSFVPEMRWSFSLEAVVVGILVWVVWVGISGDWTTQSSLWIKLGLAHPSAVPAAVWDPKAHFGSGLACLFIAVRVLGSALVVPPLEEAFYRSFLYRYITNQNFLSVPLNRFLPVPFISTAVIFGVSHNEWLAGIFCGAAYQWLVIRKNRLGDAMTAHAITNFLLGVWVIWRHAWNFW
jgi:CAAX prenyl protease-like protein